MSRILGIDEVGRGCWAGPLVVGAVILDPTRVSGLTDSKLLSPKKRTALTILIKQEATAIGLGWVGAKIIDRIGLSAALKLATEKAVENIPYDLYDEIIIDGTIKLLDDPKVSTLKKADLLIPAVSAASIVAKVARDSYMSLMDQAFVDFGFSKHVGYGTALHMQKLAELGATPLHRMSFKPLQAYAGVQPKTENKRALTTGAIAEEHAAHYLRTIGYAIVEQNWKTPWAEIDIIATKSGRVHFVEVKYRLTNDAGRGLEQITTKKQRQMKFAAASWCKAKNWQGDQVLSGLELSGNTFKVTEWIEVIEPESL